MPNKLKIDLEQLDSSIETYVSSIEEFETMIKTIDTSLDNLKNSGWKSGAKDAFFTQYDDKWKQNMQTHITVLTHLKDCLIKARSEFVGVVDEIPAIGNVL